MSRGILLSSIASIDLSFIIFSRKIAEYAHIWQRLIIEIVTLPANFSQAPRKWLSVHESSNVECCPSRTQWSGTSMELGLVISNHNTPPGLTVHRPPSLIFDPLWLQCATFLLLTHWDRDKMASVLQTFSMLCLEWKLLWSQFHPNMFPGAQLVFSQHLFR